MSDDKSLVECLRDRHKLMNLTGAARRKTTFSRAADAIERLTRERDEARDENTRLRAAIANGGGACVYCSLPADKWVECKSGFPGCARADDALGCAELGARLELAEARAAMASARNDALEEAAVWHDLASTTNRREAAQRGRSDIDYWHLDDRADQHQAYAAAIRAMKSGASHD